MENNHIKLLSENVNEHIEKKGSLKYLSWAWAWAEALKADASATFEVKMFGDLPYCSIGQTCMVWVTATLFGKPLMCQLPVMDHKNKAIANPDAFAVNTAIMRCLAKAIALHGLGLYIYAGEDLPEGVDAPFDDEPVQANAKQQPPLSKSELDSGVKDISTAPDESALRQIFGDWYRLAKSANDENAVKVFTACKDERKKQFA